MNINDKWVKLSCQDRLRKIAAEQLRQELKEKGNIDVRLTKVVLDTGKIEYLLSNIPESLIFRK